MDRTLILFTLFCLSILFPLMAFTAWFRFFLSRRRDDGRRAGAGRWVWTALLILEGGMVLYGFIEPYRWETTHRQIAIPGLTTPVRIAHLTDLHLHWSEKIDWEDVLDELERSKPDLVLLTGDYLDDSAFEEKFGEILFRLVRIAGQGRVMAVEGNFEWDGGMENVYQSAGVRLLRNEIVTVSVSGQILQVAGISFPPGPRFQKIATQISPQHPAILLHHTPDLAETPGIEAFQLVLCGHTHGGQVRLPIYGALYAHSPLGRKYQSGLYRLSDKTQLLVNRGLGTEPILGFRLRFLCRPELAILELAS